MSTSCVFCRIIRGELPCTRIYEDEHVLAFLDIGPLVKGHALVIPKRHLDPLTAVPPDLLGHLMSVVQRVATAQVERLGATGINVHQSNGAVAGQVVPHVHFHVIPRFADDGHRWNWTPRRYDSPEEFKAMGERLAL